MVAPIDYRTQVASPFESAVQGLQFGAGIADMQRAAQQRESAAEAQKQQSAAIRELIDNPNATAKDYAKLTLLAPGLESQIKQSWELHSEGEKAKSLPEIASVYSAVQANKPEIAADIFNRRAEALRNTGGPQEQIDAAERMAKLAIEAPEFLRLQTGIQLANIPGGDKIIESVAKSAETRRKEGLYPGEIDKQAADLGLTKAQTAKILAETEKLSADAKKVALEAEAGEIADPEKRFNAEAKLRKEYSDQTKNFAQVQEAYRRIGAAQDSAAGDLSLIFSYMKMLDPGSTVREGEFATAQNAAGVDERVINLYNNIATGERLNEGQRKSFKGQSDALFKAAEIREKDVRKGLTKIAGNAGLNVDNVFLFEEETESPEETQTKVITVDY
jgi:hypothetical protein